MSDFVFTKHLFQMLVLKQMSLLLKNDSISRAETLIISFLYHCTKIIFLTIHREINLLQIFLLDF